MRDERRASLYILNLCFNAHQQPSISLQQEREWEKKSLSAFKAVVWSQLHPLKKKTAKRALPTAQQIYHHGGF